jgi:hypothetical protein
MGCGGEGGPEEARPTEDAGVPVCTLSVVDSIGVEMGDSAYVFGSIEGLGHTPTGRIAVLDRVSADVRLYDGRGRMVRRIARRGSGPGELNNPLGMILYPDGRIGVVDPWSGGVLAYDTSGAWLGTEVAVSSNAHLDPVAIDESSFVAGRTRVSLEDGDRPMLEIYVGRFPGTAEPDVVYWLKPLALEVADGAGDMAQRYYFSNSWTADPATGRVYAAPFSETDYRILRFSPDGTELPPLEREVEAVRKTDEEIAADVEFVQQKLRSLEGGDPGYSVRVNEPWPYRLPVADLDVDAHGNLWALNGTADRPVFDIWAPDGTLAGRAVLADRGREAVSWEFTIDGHGILAYDTDPALYQKVYVIRQTGGRLPGQR